MNRADPPVLRLTDVHKEYAEPASVLHVLRGLSFVLYPAEMAMVMGPSGSGKTTLLQIAGCMIRASAGGVELCGHDVARMPEARRIHVRRRHLGFVFQSFHLVPALSVYENVALGLRLKRRPLDRARIMHLLDELGIAAKARKRPKDLSGGEKQRVAIARGLVGRPDLLLADEPTSQLDSRSAEVVTRLLRDVARESRTAVVIVTHDPRIREIADRTFKLDNGVLQ